MERIIFIYALIGIIYTFINAFRDMDDPDPLTTLAWLFFWPIFFIQNSLKEKNMWDLKGNEKSQKELDAYPRPMKFRKAEDSSLKKKTITLASVIWRMIFKQEDTCYIVKNESHQCNGTRARSVEDIYSTAKSYVKDITREKVEQAIDKLRTKGLIGQHFCDDVKRRVHTPQNLKTTLTEVKNALK